MADLIYLKSKPTDRLRTSESCQSLGGLKGRCCNDHTARVCSVALSAIMRLKAASIESASECETGTVGERMEENFVSIA